MDGLKERLNQSKERLNQSIQYRLSFSISAVIITAALAASLFSFAAAFHRAQELQDDVLFQTAALVDQGDRTWELPDGGIELEDSDHDSWLYVQALKTAPSNSVDAAIDGPTDGAIDPSAAAVVAHRMPSLASTLADGMHTVDSGGQAYRVFVKTTRDGSRIAVSQETRVRDAIAYSSALDTLLLFLILVPVLLILITLRIRKIFRPITALSRHIDARPENDLRPMPAEHLPSEVRPFVHAINRLLARVAESITIQRRFVADAAHELRSPLTALSLQAERLDHVPMSDAARERLRILQGGIRRGRDLLNQLLSLSRVQTATDQADTEIHVRSVYRSVLEDLMPLARAKRIDLGVLDGCDVVIEGNALDLATMIRNLVDNAIRYTAPGGRVDLSVKTLSQSIVMQVADTGPGIPPEERERVFDPFHRLLGTEQSGSGLGLAIVKTIAERLGADVQLGFTDLVARTGLVVTITLPHQRQ